MVYLFVDGLFGDYFWGFYWGFYGNNHYMGIITMESYMENVDGNLGKLHDFTLWL